MTTHRRILITGSRSWSNWPALDRELTHLCPIFESENGEPEFVTTIVHGACPRGADAMANQWCLEEGRRRNVNVEAHPADWSQGKTAGFVRNQRMADRGADLCLAFWDGDSRGTLDMIQRSVKAGIPVRVVPAVAKREAGRP